MLEEERSRIVRRDRAEPLLSPLLARSVYSQYAVSGISNFSKKSVMFVLEKEPEIVIETRTENGTC